MIRLARALGLRGALRKLYYRLVRPSDGLLAVTIGGVTGRFRVDNPDDLRVLESAGGAGGEQRVLETILAEIRPGDIIFDVGANVGLYSVLLARRTGPTGRVVAFEPEPATFARLQANVRLNSLDNVVCVSKALGDHSGEARLFASPVIGSFSLVEAGRDGEEASTVEIDQGDRLIGAGQLPPPRLVKIDVEGYEYHVALGLRGTLTSPTCQIVCCEVHPSLLPPEITPAGIENLFAACGFSRFERSSRWDGTSHLLAYKA